LLAVESWIFFSLHPVHTFATRDYKKSLSAAGYNYWAEERSVQPNCLLTFRVSCLLACHNGKELSFI